MQNEQQVIADTAGMISSVYARSADADEFVAIMATYQTVRVDTRQLYAAIHRAVFDTATSISELQGVLKDG